MATQDMQERKIQVIEFFKICPYCGREIIGYSPGSVDWNLKVHLDTKHTKEARIKK